MKLDQLAEQAGVSNEQITAYLKAHPDEVFGARELYQRLKEKIGLNALRLRLAHLYDTGELDRLMHASEYLYGAHGTVAKARELLTGAIDET